MFSLIAKLNSLENRHTAASWPCVLRDFACCLLATLTYAPQEDLEDVPTLCTSSFILQMVLGLMVTHKGPFGCGSASTGLNHRCIL